MTGVHMETFNSASLLTQDQQMDQFLFKASGSLNPIIQLLAIAFGDTLKTIQVTADQELMPRLTNKYPWNFEFQLSSLFRHI